MAAADVKVVRSGEFMVALVEGLTERGVEFVDAWTPGSEMVVFDSGRIVVPEEGIAGVVSAAETAGLSVESVQGDGGGRA